MAILELRLLRSTLAVVRAAGQWAPALPHAKANAARRTNCRFFGHTGTMRRRGFLLSACASALCSRAADRSLGTIAYLQADGLWVRDLPDGRPRKVSKGAKAPCFSPSGEWVAFGGG